MMLLSAAFSPAAAEPGDGGLDAIRVDVHEGAGVGQIRPPPCW